MRLLKLKLHWQILISLVLAICIGLVLNVANNWETWAEILGFEPDSTEEAADTLGAGDPPAEEVENQPAGEDGNADWFEPVAYVIGFFGTMFLNALKMIMIPLIVSSIITGVMNIGADKDFGRLGAKTIFFYMATAFLAVIMGLLFVNLLKPGDVPEEVFETMRANAGGGEEMGGGIEQAAEGVGLRKFFEIFHRMIPTNVVKAAVEGQLLGLIFFSILYGYFASRLPDKHSSVQAKFWESFNGLIINMTDWIIKFAPIGVFGLVTPVIMAAGPELFKPLLKFAATVFLGLGFHFFVTLPLFLKFIAKENPINHYKAMAPALLTAFSTSSSSATLPVTMECVRDNAKVSKKITSFTLPLGATINMDGTALFECVVVVFLAQLFGVEMGVATQFQVVVMALLTSIGVAGIPSASLVAIIVILQSVGFNQEQIAIGVGIVFVVDRLLDMSRTVVNVFGDSCAAVVIGKSEGETGYYIEDHTLDDAIDETSRSGGAA